MARLTRGFSLLELLVALSVSLCLSMMMFQLFHQNARVMRDQTLVMEMQQTARVVAAQIADEIRMAGQGVPAYAARFDDPPSEAVAVILPSSTSTRIDFRTGLSNADTAVTNAAPIEFSLGSSRSILVADGSMFPSGRFAYVWGPSAWLRAQVTSATSTSLTLTPREMGSMSPLLQFPAPPTVSLDEAVSIYFTGGSVRRATAVDLTNPSSPTWSAANEIGKNFTALTFIYYDASGNISAPTSLANRQSIARVDTQLSVQTAAPLSDGSWPIYSLALRTIPRNVRIRTAN